jgi:hypothetical protein
MSTVSRIPPLFLRVSIYRSGKERWSFWLPLFLVWLLLLPFVLVLGVPLLAVGWVLALAYGFPGQFARTPLYCYEIFCALRGTSIEMGSTHHGWSMRLA